MVHICIWSNSCVVKAVCWYVCALDCVGVCVFPYKVCMFMVYVLMVEERADREMLSKQVFVSIIVINCKVIYV